jgi:MYXO-CTERM domain-containing protein
MKNDPWWGMDCDAPPAGHDQPPCQAGKYVCKNGQKTCEGAVGPQPEICDLKDNDCDGKGDTLAACPGKNACVQGVCVEPCHGGEFPCPGGYECQSFPDDSGGGTGGAPMMKKYCVPTTCNAVECPPGASCKDGKCTLDNTGGTGNTAGSTATGGDGTGDTGGDNTGTGGDGTGNVAQAGDNTGNTAGTDGSGATGNTGTPPPHGVFGIVTGGGGCGCRTTPQRSGWLEALAGLLIVGAAITRRRRGGERRAS